MPQKQRKDFFIPLARVIGDAAAIACSLLFCYWLRFYSILTKFIPITSGLPPLKDYLFILVFLVPVWLWIFKRNTMYQPRRITNFFDEFFVIIRLVFMGMLILMAATFFYRGFSFSRVVFGFIGLTAVVFIAVERFFLLKFEQFWYANGHDTKKVIIAGANFNAFNVLTFLSRQRKTGYKPLGYFSAYDKPSRVMKNMPYLGILKTIPDYIRRNNIDVLILAFQETEHPLLSQVVHACQGLDVEMMMVPDILDVMTSQVQIKYFNNIPLLGIKTPALTTWNAIVKRVFDFCFSLASFIVISPVFVLIMILIKMDSRGPIFYLQERVGLDGKIFKVMKFRSMKVDAERHTGPVWARKNDVRTTRLGKFLRRFSLDELPQLINVLKGDMSIVGPRPERPHFVEKFKDEIPKYLDRHRVKTGMTGWAQVNGLRGNAAINERTKFDVHYVENWSLIFDLKIILKTINAVFFGSDAY